MTQAERVIGEFLGIVRTEAVSGREGRMARLLKPKLEGLDFRVQEDNAGRATGGDSGNLIALPSHVSRGGERLVLCAHMDTVCAKPDVRVVYERGMLRSDGSTILGADDAAGIAAILEGVRRARERGRFHAGVAVVFTVAEESNLGGSRHLDYEMLGPRLGFVFDSSRPVGVVVASGPAQARIDAKVIGKEAHAGLNPRAGVDAIRAAALAIGRMRLGMIDDETTANVGLISGGRATNVVADLVTLGCEARSLDDRKLQKQVSRMCDCLRESAARMGASVEIAVDKLHDSFRLGQDEPVVRIALRAAEEAGCQPSLEASLGGSDANNLNIRGVPAVNLGIGTAGVHTREEHISAADLDRAAELAYGLISVTLVPRA